MNRINNKFYLGILLLSISTITYAQQWHKIAYSKKMDIQVFAPLNNNQWCVEEVDVKIETSNIPQLGTEKGQKFFNKVGALIGKRCAQVQTNWYTAKSSDDTVVFKAKAQRNSGWITQIIALPTATKSTQLDHHQILAELQQLQSEHTEQVQKKQKSSDFKNNVVNNKIPKAVKKTEPKRALLPVSDFSVGRFSPSSAAEKILIGDGIREFDIPTSDGSCHFRYDGEPNATTARTLKLKTKGLSCHQGYVQGNGIIEILNSNGRRVKRFIGNFYHGYFIGNDQFSKPWLARTQTKRENSQYEQRLYYLAGSNEPLKTHYLIALSGRKGRWSFCNDKVGITVLTENEQAFIKEQQITIDTIVKDAQRLGKLYCNAYKTIDIVVANDIDWKIRNSDSVFYTYSKSQKQEQINNIALLREKKRLEEERKRQIAERNNLIKKWNNVKYRYDNLQHMRLEQRLENHFSVSLKNPLLVIAVAVIREKKITHNDFLVRIDDIDDELMITDWPIKMQLDQSMLEKKIQDEGWYIVSGDLSIPVSQDMEPKVQLTKFNTCVQDECNEVNDILAIVRKEFDYPNWTLDNKPEPLNL